MVTRRMATSMSPYKGGVTLEKQVLSLLRCVRRLLPLVEMCQGSLLRRSSLTQVRQRSSGDWPSRMTMCLRERRPSHCSSLTPYLLSWNILMLPG
ncbi:hypothetical protein MAR_023922 [Mya arenaria]|uniref:Uncharacterized protein n=1 Tax=Mya arenaria TaxID=6604 RepID=A0ABY7DQ62_MYAAR|nr:hypothetical protein MAR_023922 [Mya arenaria]